MSTAQLQIIFDNSTTANFRTWGSAVSAQLTSCGWTKTSDTGQIDWTTVVPAGGGGIAGYEIRQPASDPLQTGATVYYLKIEYGTRSISGNAAPLLRLSIGTATNGAGTFTGITTATVTNTTNNSGQGLVPFECDFSWDNSRLGVLLWRNVGGLAANAPVFFGCERTKNTDGTDNSEGATLVCAYGGASFQTNLQQTLVFGIGASIQTNLSAISSTPVAGAGTTLAFANNIPVSPLFPVYGKFGNPLTIAGIVQNADAVEGALITTTLYGSTRTYLTSKYISGGTNQGGAATAVIMRYD
jgi:hypothetical protein